MWSLCSLTVRLSFFSLCVDRIPIGIAWTVWSGVGMALIALMRFVIYEQKSDFSAVVGLVLIVAGVVIISLSSTIGAHRH